MQEMNRLEWRKNAWRVAEEIAERIDGAPVLGEFIEAQLTPREDRIFFFNKVYVKEYQQATASNKPSVPGYSYLKKLELFMQEHSQSGELYMEYLRESCTKQEGKCDYCRSTE